MSVSLVIAAIVLTPLAFAGLWVVKEILFGKHWPSVSGR